MVNSNPDGDAAWVAVVGAAGRTGRVVIAALAGRGIPVRAVVRSAAAAERAAAAGASSTVIGDLTAPSSLRDAFDGADTVHVLPPAFNQAEESLVGNALDAAAAVGVRLFGYHSVLQPDDPHLPHHLRKHRAELRIRQGPLPWVILRPAMYAQTAQSLLGGDEPQLPFGGRGRFSPIDLLDVAEATAVVLTDRAYAYGAYELAGPDVLTMADMSALVTGSRPATEPRAAAETLRDRGTMTWAAISDLAAMFAHYESHGLFGSPSVAGHLLGRAPTAFANVVKRSTVDG
ncbi:NmrA family NAD(P)-binding protein [Streptomyces sp. NBC_00988]|uniref:SDR family oxidoreductase n=1 Tax=Streptomyces sp. NBC_00988 TaxID=2903704 RepID=UPI0038648172|nr:NmrA family NAD(P)-binding protein [Streptomyces sp. NBC_00988]